VADINAALRRHLEIAFHNVTQVGVVVKLHPLSGCEWL
jgi:hypothetical protein